MPTFSSAEKRRRVSRRISRTTFFVSPLEEDPMGPVGAESVSQFRLPRGPRVAAAEHTADALGILPIHSQREAGRPLRRVRRIVLTRRAVWRDS